MKLGCNMSVKLHFIHSHFDFFFPCEPRLYHDEQGESFHQNIKDMKNSYQGRWNANMMTDVIFSS